MRMTMTMRMKKEKQREYKKVEKMELEYLYQLWLRALIKISHLFFFHAPVVVVILFSSSLLSSFSFSCPFFLGLKMFGQVTYWIPRKPVRAHEKNSVWPD